ARALVDRGRALLSRSTPRHSQDERIARHRSDPQRADARQPRRRRRRAERRRAFDNLWALQMKTGDLSGAWAWLNFHYEPWEAERSAYFGATLAAVAVATAPGGYAAAPEIQDRTKQL